REESQNVEDRRGLGGGGGGRIAVGGGIGTVILIVILSLIFGVDPRKFLGGGGVGPGPGAVGRQERPPDPGEEKQAHFTKIILHDTEVVWDEQFRKLGKTYRKPVLVLFSGEVESNCGFAEAATGPFYCPADAKVYIDVSFYRDMERSLKAPGDFARAYV